MATMADVAGPELLGLIATKDFFQDPLSQSEEPASESNCAADLEENWGADLSISLAQPDALVGHKKPFTIFYDGKVFSFEHVSEDLAKVLLKMPRTDFQTGLGHFGLKQARRASLQRFLEKRRERARDQATATSMMKGGKWKDPFGFSEARYRHNLTK